jgi:flagellar hook-associated protein 1 FlgK
MAESVGQINDLLGQLASLNTQIVRGSTTGDDVTSAMDQRDAVLAKLSEQVGIRVVTRDNNDIAVYTDSGVPLFDKQPRSVTFQATGTMTDGATGNAVMIDGVPVTGANATMPISTGKLAGLATLRDTVAPAYQTQLDEMARGLVEAFAESDQVGGGGPDLAGLFTWSGGPTVPASGVAVASIAGSLKVNAAVDPSQGGSLWRLRDGGINGADYVSNASGAASYSDRLGELVDGLSAGRSFDPAAGLQSGQSLTSFSTASVSWLENERTSVTAAADYQNTLLSRASTALSNASGVNMDDEYATQLQLEQSYAASSKLVSVIDDLFKTLLNAVG